MSLKRGQIVFVSLVSMLVFSLTSPGLLYAPQPSPQPLPVGVHRFLVEIDGIVTSNFESVEGLESAISVIEYRDGISKKAQKIPGVVTYPNIILRVSVANAKELWAWYRQVLQGNLLKKNMSIVVLNAANQELVRYDIVDAWPCAWRGPRLDASMNAPATEEFEIAIGGISRS